MFSTRYPMAESHRAAPSAPSGRALVALKGAGEAVAAVLVSAVMAPTTAKPATSTSHSGPTLSGRLMRRGAFGLLAKRPAPGLHTACTAQR